MNETNHKTCDGCETAAHCLKNGCVPLAAPKKQPRTINPASHYQGMAAEAENEKLEALQDLHLIATHFDLERFHYMAGLARRAQDELRRLNARIAELEAQAQPAREPLADEQCIALLKFGKSSVAMVRAVERAHGITKEAP